MANTLSAEPSPRILTLKLARLWETLASHIECAGTIEASTVANKARLPGPVKLDLSHRDPLSGLRVVSPAFSSVPL